MFACGLGQWQYIVRKDPRHGGGTGRRTFEGQDCHYTTLSHYYIVGVKIAPAVPTQCPNRSSWVLRRKSSHKMTVEGVQARSP